MNRIFNKKIYLLTIFLFTVLLASAKNTVHLNKKEADVYTMGNITFRIVSLLKKKELFTNQLCYSSMSSNGCSKKITFDTSNDHTEQIPDYTYQDIEYNSNVLFYGSTQILGKLNLKMKIDVPTGKVVDTGKMNMSPEGYFYGTKCIDSWVDLSPFKYYFSGSPTPKPDQVTQIPTFDVIKNTNKSADVIFTCYIFKFPEEDDKEALRKKAKIELGVLERNLNYFLGV